MIGFINPVHLYWEVNLQTMDESDELRVKLGDDGVSKLQLQVKDKLNEFMGDYTDDTLVVCSALFLGFYFLSCAFFDIVIAMLMYVSM